MSPSNKRIVCRVRVDDSAKVVEFTWSEGSASFKPYALCGRQVDDFSDHVLAARKSLFTLVEHFEQPREKRNPTEYEGACLELAERGHDLYKLVFDSAPGDRERVVLIEEWLRKITATGQVESLEIVCDGQPWFAPWNLIYDEPPDEAAFRGEASDSALAPFWGMRYNICGGQPVDPLRRMPLPRKPRILVVIDPLVLENLGRYKESDGLTQRSRLERFLSNQGLVPVTSRAELAKALKRERPHVIYWLGHADPNALHLGSEPIDQPALRDVLRRMERTQGRTGGLVFLNACRTAESGVLGSFLETFHDAEFSGLIGTEQQTLDSFANPFGLSVLEQFFTPGTTIGSILRGLRQSHGALGLLYGGYCPPDLHLQAEDEVASPAPFLPIRDLTAAGGEQLGGSHTGMVEAQAQPLPEDPYLPLGDYGPAHRALFDGRDDDVVRFAMILARPETRVLVLHGASGVGKTSFLRAGLIPYLKEDCIGFRFRGADLGEDSSPVLFIRATDDPAGQIARAIVELCASPLEYRTPNDNPERADLPTALADSLDLPAPPSAAELSQKLLDDTSLLSHVLSRLSRALPVTLLIVIDQAEEMFTLARSPDEERVRGRVLEMIRQVGDRQGDFKLIVSLRTEYYGRLASALRRGLTVADGLREYLLVDLDIPAMIKVIRRPTLRERLPHAEEIPFEKYRGFDYADDLPERIARDVAKHGRNDGVALLLQVVCAQLFERAMRAWITGSPKTT